MSDRDVEDLLRRYRPAGPPAALRDRIAGGVAVSAGRTWPWAAAAAALLAVAVGLQWSTAHVYRDAASAMSAPAADLELPALRAAVEDDERLQFLLDRMAQQEQADAAAAPPPQADR
jgi:hypothetical protein